MRKFSGVEFAALAGVSRLPRRHSPPSTRMLSTGTAWSTRRTSRRTGCCERRLRPTRYSKLTQIKPRQRQEPPARLGDGAGRMQDVGRTVLKTRFNPLIDNGFMYTTDGWGTVYKIDARNPNKGEFVLIAIPGVKHQGNAPRTRGIALWEDLVIATFRRPGHRDRPRQGRDRLGQAGRGQDRIRQAGKIPDRAARRDGKVSCRTVRATAERAAGWRRLEVRRARNCGAGTSSPSPGPGSET